ncbi:MAG: hypothetical protein IJ446_11275 [Oscillospiraceae bacterium]|nr:hypothetical protein [Oscillospiraceae bacterium]
MTLLSSLILSAVMFLSAPDALTQKEATETPCKENFYGYEIDMGEIAGTMVAEELNEYKTEFRDFVNEAVDGIVEHSKGIDPNRTDNYERLDLDDIDFDDTYKISVHQVYEEYSSFEYNADYNDFLEEVCLRNEWRWRITKNNTAYEGVIYEARLYKFTPKCKWRNKAQGYGALYIGNYVIEIHSIINNYYPASDLEELEKNSNYVKHNIAYLLNKNNEKCKDIKVIITNFGWNRSECAVLFVEGKAKYICTYGITFVMFNHYLIPSDVPQDIENELLTANYRLFNNMDYDKDDPNECLKDLYQYNMVIYYMRLADKWNFI